jgi:heme oxygenase
MSPDVSRRCARLRSATTTLHCAAERARFLVDLLAGRLPLSAYAALLDQLAPIYRALEDSEHVHRLPPGVARGSVLAADRAALALPGPRPVRRACAASDALAALAADGLPGWLALSYVRYLGDLSGGQLMRRALRRAYGDACPDAFHDFGGPGKVADRARAMRLCIEQATLSLTDERRLLAGAQRAFELHITLFDTLAELSG